jgi:hypothetical protein
MNRASASWAKAIWEIEDRTLDFQVLCDQDKIRSGTMVVCFITETSSTILHLSKLLFRTEISFLLLMEESMICEARWENKC